MNVGDIVLISPTSTVSRRDHRYIQKYHITGEIKATLNNNCEVDWADGTTTTIGNSHLQLMHAKPTDSHPNPAITDNVQNPKHYQVFPGLESIQVIARSMTVDEFRGFCKGNTLKYRMRAGKKSDLANVEQDLKKAEFYVELFNKHSGECYASE